MEEMGEKDVKRIQWVKEQEDNTKSAVVSLL